MRRPETISVSSLSAVGTVPEPGAAPDAWEFVTQHGCERELGQCGCSRIGVPESEREGRWTVFRPNGLLWIEAFYRNGQRHGTWIRWSNEGAVETTREYFEGVVQFDEPLPKARCPTYVDRAAPEEPRKLCVVAGRSTLPEPSLEATRAIQHDNED